MTLAKQTGFRMASEVSDFVGTVSRELLGLGSKSQRVGYVLQITDGRTLALEIDGSGPFDQGTFEPFEGHRCSIQAVKAGRRLLAQDIRAVDDPRLHWSLTYERNRVCGYCGQQVSDQVSGHCTRCGAAV